MSVLLRGLLTLMEGPQGRLSAILADIGQPEGPDPVAGEATRL
ncbi:MAG: hypothetical protein AAGI03_01145 [Pseudomonadota bacterium]